MVYLAKRSFSGLAGILICLLVSQTGITQSGNQPKAISIQIDTNTVIDEVFFQVKTVNRINDDSAFVTINSGKADGIFLGAEGHMMSSYNVIDSKSSEYAAFLGSREFTAYFGSAKITSITDHSATALIQVYSKYKKDTIYPADLLGIQIHPVSGFTNNIFFELAKRDIAFLSNSKEELKSKESILVNTELDFEKKLLLAYTEEIHDFYTEILKYKDSTFTTTYKQGPFKGNTLVNVFKIATYYDLYSFFHFVKSYPGKYMGRSWKINETFATWALNHAPQGDRNRDWLLPLIEEKTISQLGDFVKATSFYLQSDSLMQWTERVNALQANGKTEEAFSLCDKLIYIAQQLKNEKAEYEFYNTRSFLSDAKGDMKSALADALKARKFNPANLDYKYNLANLYGKAEDFDNCFKLYDEMVKQFPGNTNILGNYGWYKLTAGKVDEATPYCKAGYYSDTTSVAFTINYGHTFLLKGNTDSAKYYYEKTLENLNKPSDYYEGPKTDFILFFKKGWQRKAVADMAEWMDNEFNEKYLAITKGNQVWEEAKALYDKKNYKGAIAIWRKYISLFDKLKAPPYNYIHNAYNWIGSSYYSAKMYDSTEVNYTKSSKIARDYLVSQRNKLTDKENDHLVNDYERLYNLYTSTGKKDKAEQFKILYDAEVQKVTELYTSPALHIIALSSSKETVYSDKANAAHFFKSITGLNKQNAKAGYTKLLQGEKTTKEILIDCLKEVRKQSKPEDIFVFYYAGEKTDNGGQGYLKMNDKNPDQGTIAITELMDNLDLVYANKKMIITDHPNTALFSLITSKYSTTGNNSSEIIFLSPGVETPVQENGISMFTNLLAGSIEELQKKEAFSAKDFIDKASYAMGRGQYYLPVLSFSYGKDFLLFDNKNTGDNANGSIATRGLTPTGNSARDADVNTNAPQKNYALLFATDVYQDAQFNKLVNPINDAKAMEATLKNDFDFDVKLVMNPTRDEIEKWLSEYRDNKRYGPNDQLFIFFAGHGVYYDNAKMGYLVAKDSKVDDPIHKTYLSYSDLGNIYLKNISCNRIFLVLDACFAGSFFDNNTVRGTPQEIDAKNLAYLKRSASNQRFYKGISSGGKQYVADGKPGQHSPFAGSFMKILFNKALQKNFVTADEIIGEIKSNPPGSTAICEGNFHYSDPFSHFIFELKHSEKVSDIKSVAF